MERCEEFGWDQGDLPKMGWAGLTAGEVAVPDKRARVCIALDAKTFQQHDPIPRRLAEAVTAISGNRDHGALGSKPGRAAPGRRPARPSALSTAASPARCPALHARGHPRRRDRTAAPDRRAGG